MSTDDGFFKALRGFVTLNQFQQASWKQLENAFEKQTGQRLDWFFHQWIERPGLPELHTSNLAVKQGQGRHWVSFDLSQRGEIYRLDVPVTVSFKSGGETKQFIRLEAEKKPVSIELQKEPSKIVVDSDYDIARKLSNGETPPVIAAIFGDARLIMVLPPHNGSAYEPVIEGFRSRGAQIRSADSLADPDMKTASLLLLGNNNPIIGKLLGTVIPSGHGFSITVRKNPLNAEKVVGIVMTASAAEASAAFPKISHYGKYSSLDFDKGVNVHKEIADAERGIHIALKKDPTAVDISTLDRLSNVIEKVASKKNRLRGGVPHELRAS